MDYLAWNASIFNYFFNLESAGKDVLFSVDEDVIKHIARSNNILEAEALNDFCKCVASKIVKINSKNRHLIRLNEFKCEIIQDVPSQTAIIAFFILGASKMGANNNLTQKAYFPLLSDLLINIGYSNLQDGLYDVDTESYKSLFIDFETYINVTLNKKWGTIHFNNLYNNEHSRIGIPIYQSMISAKDRCFLTTYFEDIQNNKKPPSLKEINIKKYSRVFNAFFQHNVYKYKLEEKIKYLYDNWDGEICEIDSKTGIKSSILKSKYLYKKDYYNESYMFYETFKYKNSLEEFKLNDYLYKKTDSFENYYNPVPVSLDQITLSQEKIHTINEKLKVKRPLKNFILFQKDENIFDGYYLEVDNVEVGETFSIISTPSFFKSNIEILHEITGNYKLEPHRIDNRKFDLMIIENITALKSDKSLGFSQYDKIQFKKGLKNKNTNEYLTGAEPLIYLEKSGYGSIRYCIDNGKLELYVNSPIDLRLRHNEIGLHNIKTELKAKPYKIIDKLEENNFDLTYNYFDNAKQNKSKELAEKGSLINGCYIENYSPKVNQNRIDKILSIINKPNFSHNKFISKKLLAYATSINKSIDSKKYYKLNKYFKNKMVTDNIELKYLQVLEKDGVL